MSLDSLIDRFARQAPVAAMVRGLMANILSAAELDAIFRDTASRQREGKLLFSAVVELLSLVVTKSHPSLHAAYQMHHDELGVSVHAIYDKLQGVELPVTRELVRRTAERMRQVAQALEPARESLSGYDRRIIDGSHLASTEHRIGPTRRLKGGPLPGQALVVLDPQRGLIMDMLPCADGHAQERSLLVELVEELRADQLWIADRNFATVMLLHEVALNGSCFIIRRHAKLPLALQGEERACGRCQTGELYEQAAVAPDGYGNDLPVRIVRLRLDRKTEDGDRDLLLVTNLPQGVKAEVIAQEYRGRWTIEKAFGELTLSLRGEIDTLGYPGAALLGYAVALVTYNLLSVCKAAIRAAHPEDAQADQLSVYYLADEVSGAWRGMQIATDDRDWNRRFADLTPHTLAKALVGIAAHAQLRRYRKHLRGPKKRPPPRRDTGPHVSTARLLAKRKKW
jgi:IS4 transposase